MTWQTFVLFVGVYAATCALPGPAVVALTMRSIANGFWHTMPYMLGLVVADVVQLTLTAAGLAALAQAMGSAFFVVKVAGALYLVWIGYRLWVAPSDTLAPPPSTARTTFLGGVALGIGNPKALALWLALVPAVVDFAHVTIASYLTMLIVGPLFIGPAIGIAYMLAADRVRTFITTNRARKRINQVAGTALIGAGVTVAVT